MARRTASLRSSSTCSPPWHSRFLSAKSIAPQDRRDGKRQEGFFAPAHSAWRPASPGTIRYGPGMRSHDYGGDVLAAGRRKRPQIPQLEAEYGLVVEDIEGRFCGAGVACDKGAVPLEDRPATRRVCPLTPAGFMPDGRPATLVRPATAGPPVPARPTRTASGSVAAPPAPGPGGRGPPHPRRGAGAAAPR